MNIARHISYVATPTECLHRVVGPILHLHLHLQSPQPNHQQTRFISFTASRLPIAAPSRPRDELITSPLVRVVSEESGRLLPPESPKQILSRMDRQKFFLVQVSESQSPDTVCKIMIKGEEVERERRKVSLSQSRPDMEEKEVHFKWGIEPNDLKRKMDSLAGFLEEGKRVIVRLRRLRAWMIPSAEKVEFLEGSIKTLVEGMEGVKEYRPMEETHIWHTGHVDKVKHKGNVTFYFQGPTKKEETIEATGIKETRRQEREQEMEERKEKRRKRAEERKGSLQNPVEAKI